MSLPLKRRIARAALLVAAAAPVIGMGATTASAAEQPQATELGGLSNLDQAVPLDNTVTDSVPTTDGLGLAAGKNAVPVAKAAVGTTSKAVDQVTGETTTSVRNGDVVSSAMPVHTSQVPQASELAQDGLQSLQYLPLKDIPPQALPLQALQLG